MLQAIDLKRVFETARSLGYESCEIYAEARLESWFVAEGKLERTRLSTQGGISLRLFDGATTHHFATNSFTTEALLGLLGEGDGGWETTGPCLASERSKIAGGNRDRIFFLSQLAKTAWPESEKLQHPRVQYQDVIRVFEIATSDDTRRQGREESAEVRAHWVVESS